MSGWSYKENQDKYKHFVMGMLLAGLGFIASKDTGGNHAFHMLFVGFLGGSIKEVLDHHGTGTSELNDFTATVAGSAFIALMWTIGGVIR
jgi:hypothetical protein